MTLHAITVIGQDRPGIIAATTAALGDLGLNLEDSTMTLLRGHFAMVLVCRGEASTSEVEAALAPVAADGTLDVAVRVVEDETPTATASPAASRAGAASYVLTVHGADRTGIVSSVVARVAEVGGNVTDLTTRLAGELYLLVAEVDLPDGVDHDALAAALEETARALGVAASLRPLDSDEL